MLWKRQQHQLIPTINLKIVSRRLYWSNMWSEQDSSPKEPVTNCYAWIVGSSDYYGHSRPFFIQRLWVGI